MTAGAAPEGSTASGERTLRALVVVDVFLGAVSLVVDRTMPADTAVRGPGPNAAGSDAASPLLWAWMAMVAITVLGWLGLVYLIRASRALYLASWLGYLALAFAAGGAASPALRVVQLLSALTGGAILALAWFSPLRAQFRSLRAAFDERPAGSPDPS